MPSEMAIPERAVQDVIVYTAPEIRDDEYLMLAALQGIVNRKGPRFYLGTCQDGQKLLEGASKMWMDYYKEKKGYTFAPVTSLDEVITAFAADIKGMVIYDDASRDTALTISGLYDLLPVSGRIFDSTDKQHQVKEKKGKLRLWHRKFASKDDLRGKWQDRSKAYQWALDNLMQGCNKKAVYLAPFAEGAMPGLGGLDYAILRKMFCASTGRDTLTGGIMEKLQPPAAVYFGGQVTDQIIAEVGSYGNYPIVSDCPDLSFHTAVGPSAGFKFRQKVRYDTSNVTVEPKYYVAVIVNDGRRIGPLTNVFNGNIFSGLTNPVSLGFVPTLVADFPGMMEFYYQNLPDNVGLYADTFIGKDVVKNVESLAGFYRPLLEAADLPVVVSYDSSNDDDQGYYERFLNVTGTQGIAKLVSTEVGNVTKTNYAGNGQPVMQVCGNLNSNSVQSIKKMLLEAAQKYDPPFFFAVRFSGTEANWNGVLKSLFEVNSDKFKFVRLDECMAAARLAGRIEIEPFEAQIQKEAKADFSIIIRNYCYSKETNKPEPIPEGFVILDVPRGWSVVHPSNVVRYKQIPYGKEVSLPFHVIPDSGSAVGVRYKIRVVYSSLKQTAVSYVTLTEPEKRRWWGWWSSWRRLLWEVGS
jgi:hypothetical protein